MKVDLEEARVVFQGRGFASSARKGGTLAFNTNDEPLV